MSGRSLRAFYGVYGVGVMFVIVTVSGCVGPLSGVEESVYPRFSLVDDFPDRVQEVELTVEGPGMSTIRNTMTRDDRSLVLEIPTGQNRTIQLLTDDVYSSRVTTNLATGRTYEFFLPLLAGPVYVDTQGNRVVQIRDLSGVGQRAYDGPGGEPNGNPFELTEPIDAAYDATGRLWVASQDSLAVFSDLSEGAEPVVENSDVGEILAIAVDSANRKTYFVTDTTAFVGSKQMVISKVDLHDDLLELADQPLLIIDDIDVYGMDLGPNGVLYLVRSSENDDEVIIEGYDANDFDSGPLYSANIQATLWNMQANTTPIADVRATDRGVLVVVAHADTANTIYRYSHTLSFQESWGSRSEEADPARGELWGPRRFVATRRENELIVIDQQVDEDFNSSAPGRLVQFEFGTTDGWQTFDDGVSDYFDTDGWISA